MPWLSEVKKGTFRAVFSLVFLGKPNKFVGLEMVVVCLINPVGELA